MIKIPYFSESKKAIKIYDFLLKYKQLNIALLIKLLTKLGLNGKDRRGRVCILDQIFPQILKLPANLLK